jgi:hypothetical protein
MATEKPHSARKFPFPAFAYRVVNGLESTTRYRPPEKPFNGPYQLSIIVLQPEIVAIPLLTKTDPDQIRDA